jgi:hypothetical protein
MILLIVSVMLRTLPIHPVSRVRLLVVYGIAILRINGTPRYCVVEFWRSHRFRWGRRTLPGKVCIQIPGNGVTAIGLNCKSLFFVCLLLLTQGVFQERCRKDGIPRS